MAPTEWQITTAKKQFSVCATNTDLYTHDYISGRSVDARVK
jgi:hypothetical protein